MPQGLSIQCLRRDTVSSANLAMFASQKRTINAKLIERLRYLDFGLQVEVGAVSC
jgi:hypothetical protein